MPDAPVRPHIALYAGSFDPITFGHLDVIHRARRLFDEIVVGIGYNPDKTALFGFDERVKMAEQLVDQLLRDHPGEGTVRVERYSGLTVDFAMTINASAILRGIRNITDLAHETQLAITNRQVADIETVFIVTGEEFAYTSSSLIRQIAALGGSIDRLKHIVPPPVLERMRAKMNDPANPLSKLAEDAHID
jgi:pantetheine-phosphate adenylyltransferase